MSAFFYMTTFLERGALVTGLISAVDINIGMGTNTKGVLMLYCLLRNQGRYIFRFHKHLLIFSITHFLIYWSVGQLVYWLTERPKMSYSLPSRIMISCPLRRILFVIGNLSLVI